MFDSIIVDVIVIYLIMRFNVASRGFSHPKYLFFHKKWDREPNFRPGWFRQWRRTFYMRRKMKIQEISVPIARGYSTVDAVQLVNEKAEPWVDPHIWPYERKFEPETPDDPEYKPVRAQVFSRMTTILEGFKGAMNFSNTVMEGEDNLPNEIAKLESTITIEDSYIRMLEKRLRFAVMEDSILQATPRIAEYPKLHKKPKWSFGCKVQRKESNILSSFYDVCQLWISAHHGLIDRRRLNLPNAWLPFIRDNQLVVLDLNCEFVSLVQRSSDNYLLPVLDTSKSFDEPTKTIDKDLISIYPCNWEICFQKTHWYPSEFPFNLPEKDQIHTIYLTDSQVRLKKFVDRFAKGRALMFCYGYAAAQYRNWHGNRDNHEDPVNYQVLQNPILVNNIFSNLSKNSIGFCNFQLNTTSFDSDVKNQVWFNGPFDIDENKELILKKMIAINLFGPYNQPSLVINSSDNLSNQSTTTTVN